MSTRKYFCVLRLFLDPDHVVRSRILGQRQRLSSLSRIMNLYTRHIRTVTKKGISPYTIKKIMKTGNYEQIM